MSLHDGIKLAPYDLSNFQYIDNINLNQGISMPVLPFFLKAFSLKKGEQKLPNNINFCGAVSPSVVIMTSRIDSRMLLKTCLKLRQKSAQLTFYKTIF
jgi:hypothetical protein